MRTRNAVLNISTSLLGYFLTLVFTFINRRIFVSVLDEEYLGVNGLFSNVISMLSLAELGIGSAIIYSMYRPLAEKNETQIKALMNFYSKAYRTIGVIVLIIGFSLYPFLDFIIKNKPDIPNVKLYFFIFLFNTVLTYFVAHRRSMLIADQKSYILSYYHYLYTFALNIIQIIILIQTENFLLYLLTQTILILLENILIYQKSKKMYPFINDVKKHNLDGNTKKEIFKNTHALIYHKIGSIVVFSTDNVVISSFLGLSLVGIYSNYFLVISALNNIMGKFFTSIIASIGNLNAVDSKEKTQGMFRNVFFANFWLISLCSIILLVTINPFISLWIGEKYLFDNSIVYVLVLNFYVMGMRSSVLIFKDALGIYWPDRYKSLIEAVVNIILSIILVKYLGIIGVFLGTFISTVTICLWVEPYVLYKHGFQQRVKEYFIKYSLYCIVTLVACIITFLICSNFTSVTWLSLIGRLAVGIVVPNIIFILCFYKTEEYKYFLIKFRKVINILKRVFKF